MNDKPLIGTAFTTSDALDRIRARIYESQFQIADDIRQFVNRYVASNSQMVVDKSTSTINELAGAIRSDLGLMPAAQPGFVQVIPEHVRDLVNGRAYASQDTARWAVHHAANQVTMYSGQFIYAGTHIFIDGAGIDFDFHVTYKNQGFHNGPLGTNWDHNYNLLLREVDGGEKLVRLTGGFQESDYLRNDHNNYWAPPPGEHSIIVDLADWRDFGIEVPSTCTSCRYALRTSSGSLYFYEEDPDLLGRYRIRQIQDRNKNYLLFFYRPSNGSFGESLKKVQINCESRYVYFDEPDGPDEHGRIRRIQDHIGRTWRYEYDDFGDLVAFTTPGTDRYPGGLTERYVYSSPYYTGELQHNLVQVYDTAGRLYIENEYSTDYGLLSFNRVVRQREGRGERYFEYEDISLATGTPVGQLDLEEDYPAHQTVMTRRNGHPIHYIYNKFGNLIAQEEDIWTGGIRRRLLTHYRYNRDGALTGTISPEGRETQYLYERDQFHLAHALSPSDDVRSRADLTWRERLSFGNRLAVVQRNGQQLFSGFQYPSPMKELTKINAEDIVIKYSYEDLFQNIKSVSDPRFTRSPYASGQEDDKFQSTLTRFEYEPSTGRLTRIIYPATSRNEVPEFGEIDESFTKYDDNGRLLEYKDHVGTVTQYTYYPQTKDNAEAPKEGYLHTQVIDPAGDGDEERLDLKTEYVVDGIGNITRIVFPKDTTSDFAVNEQNPFNEPGYDTPKDTRQAIDFTVNKLNQVVKVTRTLKPGVAYETRYTYCRNMHVEQVERDVQDQNGHQLSGGTEVTFFHYDENDNMSRMSVGSLDFDDHLITRHVYDDGDLRTATILPRGNRINVKYDERRLPIRIIRGVGTSDKTSVKVVYDGDGLVKEYRDGRDLKTVFLHDSFGRIYETRQYDESDNLFRLILQKYDKAGNLTAERVFVPEGQDLRLLWHAQYVFNERNEQIEVCRFLFKEPIRYTESDFNTIPKKKLEQVQPVRILYFYDKGGRISRIEKHGRRFSVGETGNLTHMSNRVMATSYEYNAVGWPTKERLTLSPIANWAETHYDKHGMVSQVDVHEVATDSPTGEEVFTTFYKYDDFNRKVEIKDGLGNKTPYEYDSRDLLVRKIDPLGNVVHYEYDIYGRKIAEAIQMTDTGLGDGKHMPEADVMTKFAYDPNGNLIQITDAHNVPFVQEYDALDRKTALRFADDTTTKYRYDGADNVVETRDNNGLVNHVSYDPLGNPLRVDIDISKVEGDITIEGPSSESFEYDALGRMTCAKNDWADISFSIDSLGRVYQETTRFTDQGINLVLKRDHDDFDFVSRLIYPNGRIIGYTSDDLNRILEIKNYTHGDNYPGSAGLPPQHHILVNTYRGLRPGRKGFGDATAVQFSYDAGGRVTQILHSSGIDERTMLRLQYLYDSANNVRLRHEFGEELVNYGEVYGYDSRYQLIKSMSTSPATELDLTSFIPHTSPMTYEQTSGQEKINEIIGSMTQDPTDFTFKIDKLGNRLVERANGHDIHYEPNVLNQYMKRGEKQFQYDLNGNLMREMEGGKLVREFLYDHRNRITHILDSENDISIRYDALGRRVWQSQNGEETVCAHDDMNVVEEWMRETKAKGFDLSVQYVNESDVDSVCQLVSEGQDLYYHKDLVGSTHILTDMNGKVSQYRYSPFGTLLSQKTRTESQMNLGRYAGRPAALGNEIYDFRARQYHEELGRFLQRDPLLSAWDYGKSSTLSRDIKSTSKGINLYIYADNDPVSRVDPLGLEPQKPLEDELTRLGSPEFRNRVFDELAYRAEASAQTIEPAAKLVLWLAPIVFGGAMVGISRQAFYSAITQGSFSGTLNSMLSPEGERAEGFVEGFLPSLAGGIFARGGRVLSVISGGLAETAVSGLYSAPMENPSDLLGLGIEGLFNVGVPWMFRRVGAPRIHAKTSNIWLKTQMFPVFNQWVKLSPEFVTDISEEAVKSVTKRLVVPERKKNTLKLPGGVAPRHQHRQFRSEQQRKRYQIKRLLDKYDGRIDTL